jgi:hypothetical protein
MNFARILALALLVPGLFAATDTLDISAVYDVYHIGKIVDDDEIVKLPDNDTECLSKDFSIILYIKIKNTSDQIVILPTSNINTVIRVTNGVIRIVVHPDVMENPWMEKKIKYSPVLYAPVELGREEATVVKSEFLIQEKNISLPLSVEWNVPKKLAEEFGFWSDSAKVRAKQRQ